VIWIVEGLALLVVLIGTIAWLYHRHQDVLTGPYITRD
jgi:hypothetical protein